MYIVFETFIILIRTLSMQNQITNIYNQYMADIYRYCFARLENKEQAEDITAETFVTLLTVKDITQIENIKFWLIGVARNKLIDKYRKAEARLSSDMDLETAEIIGLTEKETLEEIQIEAELLEEIKHELQTLDEITREILVLRHWEDFKFNEIAEMFMVSESTIKSKYYRGLGAIKNNIEQKSNKGKKIRAVSIPLLFLALPKIKADAAFAPSSQFASNLSNLIINNSNMNRIMNWIKARKLPVIVSSCVILVLIIAAVILLQANNANGQGGTNNSSSSQTSLSTTSSSSSTSSVSSETSSSVPSTSSVAAFRQYEATLSSTDYSNPPKVLKSGKLTITSKDALTIKQIDVTAITVEGQGVSMGFGVPSDGGEKVVENMVAVFTHPQLGQVYRWKPNNITVQGETISFPYYYINTVKDCELMDGTKKKCTPEVLDFGLTGLYLNVSCSEASDLAKCDEIVKSMKFTQI